jgi:hypothetical protein
MRRQMGRTVEHTNGRTHTASGIGGIMPVINGGQIRFVLRKLNGRGPTWARECMDRVEGFDCWLQHVQAAVQAAEREALE